MQELQLHPVRGAASHRCSSLADRAIFDRGRYRLQMQNQLWSFLLRVTPRCWQYATETD
jgi:hypothetical protein